MVMYGRFVFSVRNRAYTGFYVQSTDGEPGTNSERQDQKDDQVSIYLFVLCFNQLEATSASIWCS